MTIFFTVFMIAGVSHADLNNGVFKAVRMTGLEINEIEQLTVTLKSLDPFVRVKAAQELGELGDPAGTNPLIKALEDDNIYVRAYAAEALGKIKQSKAVEPLIAALSDEDEFVQAHIVQSLGELKDSRAVKPLIELLNGEKQVIKIHAARALGEIRDLKAVGALIIALKDEVSSDYAADALKKITEQDFANDYKQWNNWWLSRHQLTDGVSRNVRGLHINEEKK
jgi:HEAT repeat protein